MCPCTSVRLFSYTLLTICAELISLQNHSGVGVQHLDCVALAEEQEHIQLRMVNDVAHLERTGGGAARSASSATAYSATAASSVIPLAHI